MEFGSLEFTGLEIPRDHKAEGEQKEILFRIIHKYGADKLKI